MNIGFYGHSNVAYKGPGSYLNIVADHFGANIVSTGVKQGSEERILHELKRTRKLDVAVVVHSYASCLYLPDCDRDVALSMMSPNRADYLFKDFDHQENPLFVRKFKSGEFFYECITQYKQYLYNPDVQHDRFVGAALQIDQYLKAKNITTVHILERHRFPAWFQIQHGYIDMDNIVEDFKTHVAKRPFFYNCITEEGNYIVGNKLIDILTKCGL